MHRRATLVACFLTAIMAFCGNAFAWGPVGHRTVCQIAFLLLDPSQQSEVARLTQLYQTPDGHGFASFGEGCTFPDDARAKARDQVPGFDRFTKFENWHFLNLPRTATVATASPCADDCVLKGIDFHTAALRDPASSDTDRAEALFFLGHWLGDIHQPLHVSYKDDLGGNKIKPIKGGFYSSPHLHSVWDSGIISKDIGSASVADFATRLTNAITPAEKTSWLTSTPIDWAEESYAITISPDVEYCKSASTAAGTRCNKDHPTSGRTLTPAYQSEFQDKVETRLEQAGVRLADLIRNNLPSATTAAAASATTHAHTSSFVGQPALYPDPKLTPGATNPDVTQANIAENICKIGWSTKEVRDTQTTPAQKTTTYKTYGIPHPKNNTGANQVCELDHLISIENGGADSLDNIWPECGPDGVPLAKRYFKLKDAVENFVHNGICHDVPSAKFSSGRKTSKALTLEEGQSILRGDWYACYLKLNTGKDCN
jgi:hypothetical protein